MLTSFYRESNVYPSERLYEILILWFTELSLNYVITIFFSSSH